MTTKLRHHLRPLASPQNLLLLLSAFLLLALAILPAATSELRRLAGGHLPPDWHFHYRPEQLHFLFDAYGKEGRELFVFVEMTADLVWAVCTALLSIGMLEWLRRRLSIALPYWLLYLPLGILGLEILENAGLVALTFSYPFESYLLSRLTALATVGKWAGYGVVVGLLAIGAALWAWRFFWGSRERGSGFAGARGLSKRVRDRRIEESDCTTKVTL